MSVKDKIIEQDRYNNSSNLKQNYRSNDFLKILGADNFESHFQAPYVLYHTLIANSVKEKINVCHLDLCCGDGIHSLTSAKLGAKVIAIDYAENSIMLAQQRAKLFNLNIDFRTGDVEMLPFDDNAFDLVTCAGSLSYVDPDIFLTEVFRVLKPGGKFICVDSFNHNLFYKFNRFIHYLKGQRSYSTLKRMPNEKLLKKIKSQYRDFEVHYFGIFIFLAPLFKLLMNTKQLNNLLVKLDIFFSYLKKYSFKIVFKAIK